MADVYKVSLGIVVSKSPTEEVIVIEDYFFQNLTFSKMANISDEFYELIAKLQKVK